MAQLNSHRDDESLVRDISSRLTRVESEQGYQRKELDALEGALKTLTTEVTTMAQNVRSLRTGIYLIALTLALGLDVKQLLHLIKVVVP